MADRFRESNGIPHVIRLDGNAQWEITNEFKRDGGKRYCHITKSPFKYEYYFYFSNRRSVFDWLMDVKGPKMPRWLLPDEVYQEVKFKTLSYKQDSYGKRLYVRSPDNYDK